MSAVKKEANDNAGTGTADAVKEATNMTPAGVAEPVQNIEPVDPTPKELTPEEQQAAAVKNAVEASGVFHLNSLFNNMLKTAQKADDAIKADGRTELWTMPQVEELFMGLRGK